MTPAQKDQIRAARATNRRDLQKFRIASKLFIADPSNENRCLILKTSCWLEISTARLRRLQEEAK